MRVSSLRKKAKGIAGGHGAERVRNPGDSDSFGMKRTACRSTVDVEVRREAIARNHFGGERKSNVARKAMNTVGTRKARGRQVE